MWLNSLRLTVAWMWNAWRSWSAKKIFRWQTWLQDYTSMTWHLARGTRTDMALVAVQVVQQPRVPAVIMKGGSLPLGGEQWRGQQWIVDFSFIPLCQVSLSWCVARTSATFLPRTPANTHMNIQIHVYTWTHIQKRVHTFAHINLIHTKIHEFSLKKDRSLSFRFSYKKLSHALTPSQTHTLSLIHTHKHTHPHTQNYARSGTGVNRQCCRNFLHPSTCPWVRVHLYVCGWEREKNALVLACNLWVTVFGRGWGGGGDDGEGGGEGNVTGGPFTPALDTRLPEHVFSTLTSL